MVAILVVATGRYRQFLPAMAASAGTHVAGLGRIYVLTERDPGLGGLVTWLPWGHLPWPFPTLLRYRAFCAYRDLLEAEEVLLYVDADMRFVREVDVRGAEGTVAVQHPGYVHTAPAELPYERRPASCCAIPPGQGARYYAGGVQGGHAAAYLTACARMAAWIQHDLRAGIVPLWHDESAWNRHCQLYPPTLALPPSYCSPEHANDPEARIIALDKDHDHFRQVPRRERLARQARRHLGSARRIARRLATRYGT